MSWYTVGEIVVWLLIAGALGVVLGWLLRGILRPPQRPDRPRETAAPPRTPARTPPGTRVLEIDTGEGQTRTGSVPVVSSFAPPEGPAAARARVPEIAKRTAGDGEVPRDDLVRIHGVGPKIARLLESMGITSYRQVARFTPTEVKIVNDALEVFPGRIERDDWMSSARELHREDYGTEP